MTDLTNVAVALPSVVAQAESILLPLCVPIGLWLATIALQEWQKRGHQAAFLAGLIRAVGTAQNAATAAGSTLFDPRGQAVGLAAGVDYMTTTLSTQAAALGIDSAGIEQRVLAQIGSTVFQAQATAVATAAATAAAPAVAGLAASLANAAPAALGLATELTTRSLKADAALSEGLKMTAGETLAPPVPATPISGVPVNAVSQSAP